MLSLNDEMVASLEKILPKNPSWQKRLSLLTDYRFGFIEGTDIRYSKIQRRRVLFEVNNNQGEVVGLCGRTIDGIEPKYLHPTGYKKGQSLFNIGRVSPKEQALVVEGNFDAMTATTLWKPCVAIEGVQLTLTQAQRLATFKKGVILALDKDDAGKLATIIATHKLRALGVKVFIAQWDYAKDLDEYLREHQEFPTVVDVDDEILLNLYQSVIDYTKYSFVRDAYLSLEKTVGAIKLMRTGVYIPPKPKVGTGTRYSDYEKFRGS